MNIKHRIHGNVVEFFNGEEPDIALLIVNISCVCEVTTQFIEKYTNEILTRI